MKRANRASNWVLTHVDLAVSFNESDNSESFGQGR